jgi:perosamine synthetase
METEDRIPLFEIDWNERDVERVTESIERGGYWANGPSIAEFESLIEEYLGVAEAVVVNSGTSALVCALEGHGIGPGDEVVVPSFTFVATANAVEIVGATPVFADVERETYGLDPEAVRGRITPDTAAILPVHPYGGACRIDSLTAIADEHDLAVVEDAAETFGGTHRGRKLGTMGDSAALSFCQNKVITTGEGGAVVTDDPEVARRAELYRSHGRASEDYFQSSESGRYVDVGANLRMSDLAASLGCAQIERVEELVERRRAVASEYHDRFRSIPHVDPHGVDAGRHVYQLYTVAFDERVDRGVVRSTLDDHGVASKPYWDPPVHLTERYRREYGYERGRLPVTEDVASRVLSLPMHPNLTVDEIDRVATAVEAGIDRSLSHSKTSA